MSLADAKSRLDYFCRAYSDYAFWLRDEKTGRVLHAANTTDALDLSQIVGSPVGPPIASVLHSPRWIRVQR